MKINTVRLIIAIAVSSLIAYGLYSYHTSDNKIILSLGSFVFLATTLIFAIGINFDYPRTTTNVRALSGIFFFVGLIINFVFAFFNFSVPIYIILNGILLLIFILIAYSIGKAQQ